MPLHLIDLSLHPLHENIPNGSFNQHFRNHGSWNILNPRVNQVSWKGGREKQEEESGWAPEQEWRWKADKSSAFRRARDVTEGMCKNPTLTGLGKFIIWRFTLFGKRGFKDFFLSRFPLPEMHWIRLRFFPPCHWTGLVRSGQGVGRKVLTYLISPPASLPACLTDNPVPSPPLGTSHSLRTVVRLP